MTTNQIPRHKVFISYHDVDVDRKYKDWFVQVMRDDIVDKSVHDRDIDDSNIATETIRQKIRDDFIADATVTVVLIGPCTWQRKHVDWEIGSSLRDTKNNPRCGLMGILLPNHPDCQARHSRQWTPRLTPPRLADNFTGDNPYVRIYYWPEQWVTDDVRRWIHQAFERRHGTPPNNARQQFRQNRSGNCLAGWPD